jgi:glycogen debranching enzyme
MPGPAFPALALDGTGRQADALSSDAGHLLWSGILGPEDTQAVGRRLLEPDFFSGFGIRTLAAGQPPTTRSPTTVAVSGRTTTR